MRCFGFGVRVALGVFRKVVLLRDFPGAGFGLGCLGVNWIGGCGFTLFGVWWVGFRVLWLEFLALEFAGFCGFLGFIAGCTFWFSKGLVCRLCLVAWMVGWVIVLDMVARVSVWCLVLVWVVI